MRKIIQFAPEPVPNCHPVLILQRMATLLGCAKAEGDMRFYCIALVSETNDNNSIHTDKFVVVE